MKNTWIGLLSFLALGAQATAQVRITEYMYTGFGGEFVEFTNIGNTPVDLTNWSFDDDSRIPGVFLLTLASPLQPGESLVITDINEAVFRFDWSLPPTVRVLGGVMNNLGRNDEINLFDDAGVLVDRLTFGDQSFPGTIRTAALSGVAACDGALGANDIFLWELAFAGDSRGSYTSVAGDIGNPGVHIAPPPCVPTASVVSYCTAGTTTNNCSASMASIGTPSASAAAGFDLNVAGVEGQKLGLVFYGVSGRAALPWGTSSSFLCVKSPTQRTPSQNSSGTAGLCDGALILDWHAFMTANPGALGNPRIAGGVYQAQAWFRDPPSPKTTNLSNALEFTLAP